MKAYSFFVLFLAISNFSFSQLIHPPALPSNTKPTIQQALDEFWWYAENKNYLTFTESNIAQFWSIDTCGCNITINWPYPMLAFNIGGNGSQAIKWTGYQVKSYASVYNHESDLFRKSVYELRAKRGAEFLLWTIEWFGLQGAIFSQLCCHYEWPNVFDMATAGMGLIEMYKTFKDQRYYDAVVLIATFIKTYPPYPHQWYNKPYLYYSNANHMGVCAEFLAQYYNITSDQHYLDLAIQISEELFAWQDYLRDGDPWQDPNASNGDWDGSWYWHLYSPDPLPPGCVPNMDPSLNGNNADRRMGYHVITQDGLITLGRSIEQQRLAGLTSIRNNKPSKIFREDLFNSIIRSSNFIIDNQSVNSNHPGLISLFKWNRQYYIYNSPIYVGWQTQYLFNDDTGANGLGTLCNALLFLQKTGILSPQDVTNFNLTINSIASGLLNRRTWSYRDAWPGVMYQWHQYIDFLVLNELTRPQYTLINNSFENESIVWELWSWDGEGVNITNETAHKGKKSVRINDDNPNASKWASLMINVSPNSSFQVEAYAKIISGQQSLFVHFLDQDLNLLSSSSAPVYANEDFSKVTLITPQSPPNTKYMQIWLYAGWYDESFGFWDDVSVKASSSEVFEKISQEITLNGVDFNYSLTNYPNPFNPITKIRYSIKNEDKVMLSIYDALGRKIETLVNAQLPAGEYEIDFNGYQLPSGIYFCTLTAGNHFQAKKMILTK